MKNTFRAIAFVVQFAVLGLAVAFVIGLYAPQSTERLRTKLGFAPASIPLSTLPVSASAAPNTTENPAAASSNFPAKPHDTSDEGATFSYADAVNRAAPAVVSIYANKIVARRTVLVPSDPVLRRMVGIIDAGPAPSSVAQSLGSGVIVSSDGYILTNNHVIEGAEEIQSVLNDGRIAKASVVGTDPDTDLAVLKLDATNLPVIPVPDKAPVRVGDVVLAIGNPFGQRNTVTMGIVSAIGRQINKATYEDFIQTDAAINQGNSGGALVNAHGELVGINSEVFSPSGNNVGIGFAIPFGTAKNVLEEIVAHGKVIRGWIGAEYDDPAPLHGSPQSGVMVRAIYNKSPAAQAGLQLGDTLLTLNKDPIKNQIDLRTREASMAPGQKVEVSGLRKGSPFTATIELQERPHPQQTG